MNSPIASRAALSIPRVPSSEGETRLHGWRLVGARALVYSIAAVVLGLCLLSAPRLVTRLATSCAEPLQGCIISFEQASRLAQIGISPSLVAVSIAILSWLAIVLSGGVAVVLLWRRSDDWMALLVALQLVLMPVGYMPVFMGLDSKWQAPADVLSSIGVFMPAALMAIFPSGRFVPRWIWLPVLVEAWFVFSPSAISDRLGVIGPPLALASTLCLLGGQIYRYRHASTPVQRQQTKWAASGLVLALGINQAFWQPAAWGPVLFPTVQQPGSLYLLLFPLDGFLMVSVVAICFGIAILRYRLYDIDVIIRRTLLYATLTAILAGVYLLLVLGTQAASHALTGERGDEPIIIVVSTLLIAALFNPLRRHIQRAIDRRFYRHKYDAVKTLAAFGATLQSQPDLPQLAEHLVSVVEETMQPTHVTLWLRPHDGPTRHNLTP